MVEGRSKEAEFTIQVFEMIADALEKAVEEFGEAE